MDPFVGQWDEINNLLKSIEPASEESGSVNYFLQPNIGYEEGGEEIEKMKENFDYVLHLKGLERSGFILKFIEILEPEVQTRVPYDTTPTGLAMYVPKMLVTGPTNAGKTETVKTMSETSVSAEEGGTTVALDNGQVSMKGIKADIFGTPGEKRFDWAMNFLGESIFGAFILVDSRDPNYERANEIKENLQEKEIPLLVLANFQNKDDAKEPEEIEEKMGLETIPIDAKHGENLQESLERLMEKILTEGDLKID
jgi:small GTP-binding protein